MEKKISAEKISISELEGLLEDVVARCELSAGAEVVDFHQSIMEFFAPIIANALKNMKGEIDESGVIHDERLVMNIDDIIRDALGSSSKFYNQVLYDEKKWHIFRAWLFKKVAMILAQPEPTQSEILRKTRKALSERL